ncbi:calcium/sodium antiporter [Lentisphaera profundi]|uniref:Calcium/sodium antiporter n=1 Tax=Lentisphaera profundi TaxID=1658616 RepID=A0ABY7VT68_9BACT|nr:calcium/sodium antiporter [Lentisphaera profundi]WDE97380.1 calcium/sodium antiporter [Lentisphaera profundi]
MIVAVLLILAGGLLLYYGGDWLVDGAVGLSLRWGMSPLVVGLTVVAFGTSAPELAVCIKSTLNGLDDIALGNVIGSNICNIGLVLGLAAIVKPIAVQSQLIKIDVPVAIIAALSFVLLIQDGQVSAVDGGILFAMVVAYVFFSIKMSKKESKQVEEEFDEEVKPSQKSSLALFGLILAGLAGVTYGGNIFVDGASTVAAGLGVSDAVIGLTVVALGTSLPELAASLMASSKGHGDMALGNVVGSCIFNLLAITGITALVEPLDAMGINKVDLGVMLFLMVALLPILWTQKKLSRIEGSFLLLAYCVYTGYLFMSQSTVTA